MNLAKVKLCIFDMGGVVVDSATLASAMAESLGISRGDFFRGAGSDPDTDRTSPYNLGDIGALMRGELDSAGFWENFQRRAGIRVEGDPWYDFFKPELNGKTVSLILLLREKGRRVVCGTNTIESHYRKHGERGDYRCFDTVYASHLMGIIKPDPEFWRYILKAENAKPEETFFTDDLEENIQAAGGLGINTHLFTTAEELAQTVVNT